VENSKKNTGKMIIGSALAAVIGFGASGAGLAFGLGSAGFIMLLPFLPVVMMALYGFAGILPACVIGISLFAGTVYSMGAAMAAAFAAAFVIPGAAMIYVSKKGIPFFQQIRFGMVVQAICIVGTLAAFFIMYGSDLGGAAAEMLRENLSLLTPEQKEAAAEIFKSMYAQIGAETNYATADEFFEEIIKMFEQMMKLSLPMLMIFCIMLNGSVGPLWGNYIRARRGEENVQFVPLRGWRIPPMITLGIVIGFILTLLIRNANRAETEMIYLLIVSALVLALTVQAAASMLSRMFKAGVKTGKRTLICVLMLLFAGNFMTIYGALSALFGSQGLFMPLMRKRMEKMNQDKEDHEE